MIKFKVNSICFKSVLGFFVIAKAAFVFLDTSRLFLRDAFVFLRVPPLFLRDAFVFLMASRLPLRDVLVFLKASRLFLKAFHTRIVNSGVKI